MLTAAFVGDDTGRVVTDLAFDDVFRAHYARLVRALTAACGDATVAEDAVQEAFVKAHVRWSRVCRYEDPVGWVRHVALNHMRDHLRRAGRGRRVVERLAGRREAHTQIEPPADPTSPLAVLAALPPQQRTAMALHYVEDLPVAEIAAAMGLSDGAVKFHLHQGRKRLGSILGDTTEGDR